MSDTYKFKTKETLGVEDRTIIKEEIVPATTRKTEFTLGQKEAEVRNAEQVVTNAQAALAKVKAELAEAKTALKI